MRPEPLVRNTIRHKLFVTHFLAVVMVSGSIGTIFYRVAISSLVDNLRTRLEGNAAMLGKVVDASTLDAIRSPADRSRPEYVRLLARLRELAGASRDIAFVYVMRREGERVVFVVDSDASPRQAKPGELYDHDLPSLARGFDEVSADEEILCDQWGCFLSGYAPVVSGGGRYLVGVDMRADEVRNKLAAVRVAGLLSLCVSILAAWGLSALVAPRLSRPILGLAARAREIAAGKLEGRFEVSARDEVGELAGAFNTMSERLSDSDRRTRQALVELSEARDTLEIRVEERTAELAEANAKLQMAASTDDLTGLLNRRAMNLLLAQELSRSRRAGETAVLLLVDCDHFKRINDEFGHDVGDRVLELLARTMQENLRGHDSVARWGGEEFLLMLPRTPLGPAVQVAEKVRAAVAGTPFLAGDRRVPLTVSIGVAPLDHDGSIEASVRRADEALYRAKAEGRDRVVSG